MLPTISGAYCAWGRGRRCNCLTGATKAFDAEITSASKKSVEVKVLEGKIDDRESPLHIHLGQVMSRGEKSGIDDPEIDRTRCKPHYATFLSAAALNWIVNV